MTKPLYILIDFYLWPLTSLLRFRGPWGSHVPHSHHTGLSAVPDHTRYTPASSPLHLPTPLPAVLFPQIPAGLGQSLPPLLSTTSAHALTRFKTAPPKGKALKENANKYGKNDRIRKATMNECKFDEKQGNSVVSKCGGRGAVLLRYPFHPALTLQLHVHRSISQRAARFSWRLHTQAEHGKGTGVSHVRPTRGISNSNLCSEAGKSTCLICILSEALPV